MRTCDYCGRENPDDAFNCSGCANQLQEEVAVVKQTRAGFWIRAVARIIDIVFLMLMAALTALLITFVLALMTGAGLISSEWQQRLPGLSLLMLAAGVIAKVCYHSLCEGLYGATLGKLCCDLRVVSEDGSPSNMKGAFIRTVAYVVDSLFFGAAGYHAMRKSPLNQRYGDVWGKTAVMKTGEITSESKRTTRRLLLALGLGIASYVILVAIGFLLKIWETKIVT